MSYLQQTIKAVIRPGDEVGYVAECLEIAVITQGRTLDETVKHLQDFDAIGLGAAQRIEQKLARLLDGRHRRLDVQHPHPTRHHGPPVRPLHFGAPALF